MKGLYSTAPGFHDAIPQAYQLHWKTGQITDIPALRQDP